VPGFTEFTGPWDALVDFLVGRDDRPDAIGTRIYRRRAPQKNTKPYVVVGGPFGYNAGHAAEGTVNLKTARFNVYVLGDKTAKELTPIVGWIISATQSLNPLAADPNRSLLTGGGCTWRINMLHEQDVSESDGEDVIASDEQGLIGYVIPYEVGYFYPPYATS
jgi:hypothetical protein